MAALRAGNDKSPEFMIANWCSPVKSRLRIGSHADGFGIEAGGLVIRVFVSLEEMTGIDVCHILVGMDCKNSWPVVLLLMQRSTPSWQKRG